MLRRIALVMLLPVLTAGMAAEAPATTTPDARGQHELHRAARSGDLPLIKRLLTQGENPSARDAFGQTPLHCAAQTPGMSAGIGAALLDGGADVNALSLIGQSPLHLAVEAGNLPFVHCLVSRGAEINAVDGLGRTAVDLAITSRQTAIAESLVQMGGTPGSQNPQPDTRHPEDIELEQVQQALLAADLPRLKQLAANGVRVNNAVDSLGQSPLLRAARWGRQELAAWLLEQGAEVNKQSLTGDAPLHWAARNGDRAMAELLLAHGASPSLLAADGAAPADRARAAGHGDLAPLLTQSNPANRVPSPGATKERSNERD